jgi:hypothetical protein
MPDLEVSAGLVNVPLFTCDEFQPIDSIFVAFIYLIFGSQEVECSLGGSICSFQVGMFEQIFEPKIG